MAEYIKRDAALKALLQVSAPTPSESYIVEKCIEKIIRLPMMGVVRCKDCKHYDPFCGVCQFLGGEHMSLSDFCSYGERR
jgi:hypothetical protein